MLGVPVTASTTRRPGNVTITSAATNQTFLRSLICRKVFGVLLQPINQQVAIAELGITGNVKQIRRVVADWPLVGTPPSPYAADDWPVKPGDQLVLPQGTYPVRGVKIYPPDNFVGGHLDIYVEVPA